MFLSGLAVLTLAVGLAGCANEEQESESAPAAGSAGPPQKAGGGGRAASEEHAGHAHDEGSEHAEANSEIQEALAELPEDDRARAKEQKICPVSEEPLGSMGVPVKVTVKDRDVFLCCAGCQEAIEADPEKYLAKLD
jgi:hypothetical protein